MLVRVPLALSSPGEQALNSLFTGAQQFESIILSWHIGGILPDTLRHQRALTHLRINFTCRLQRLPDCLYCIPLQTLDIAGCDGIPELPPSLARSNTLHTLMLRDILVPDWLDQVGTLRTVELHSAMVRGFQLPRALVRCVQLTALKLINRGAHVQHVNIPDEIGQFVALEALTLKHCTMSTLPDTICTLTVLRELTITNCTWFVALPKCLGQLPHLTKLTVEKCACFGYIPDSLLGNLVQLRLDDTYRNVRLDPAKCHKVQELAFVTADSDVGVQQRAIYKVATASPFEALHTLNTKHLDIIHCTPWLRELRIENNTLTTMPEALSKLACLKLLSFEICALQALPPHMATLETLIMTHCRDLRAVPASYRNLHHLEVAETFITTIPATFTKAMQTLELTGCGVDPPPWLWTHALWKRIAMPRPTCHVPLFFLQQPMLQMLSFRECAALTVLPDGNVHLPVLKTFILDSSGIQRLPAWLTRLPSLATLTLGKCVALTCLPENIGDLETLTVLDITGLRITSIPASAGRLRRLAQLNVKSCPYLQYIPSTLAEIVVRPLEMMLAIRARYHQPSLLMLILIDRRQGKKLPAELWCVVGDMMESDYAAPPTRTLFGAGRTA